MVCDADETGDLDSIISQKMYNVLLVPGVHAYKLGVSAALCWWSYLILLQWHYNHATNTHTHATCTHQAYCGHPAVCVIFDTAMDYMHNISAVSQTGDLFG